MSNIDTVEFSDMLTTQDFSRGIPQEAKTNKRENKNQKNATECNAGKNYGKKQKTTKVMNDACKASKKKSKK